MIGPSKIDRPTAEAITSLFMCFFVTPASTDIMFCSVSSVLDVRSGAECLNFVRGEPAL